MTPKPLALLLLMALGCSLCPAALGSKRLLRGKCTIPNCATCMNVNIFCQTCKTSYKPVNGGKHCAYTYESVAVVQGQSAVVQGDIQCMHGMSSTMKVLKATWGASAKPSCRKKDVTSALAPICQGHKYCEFKVGTQVFGDPCPGVRKELNITFRCQDEIKDDGTKAGKVIVHNQLGDGQTLKADCYVSGRKIVFLRARYSATDMYRATCKSEVANGALLAKLNALCKNKWKCDVKIGATQLGVKDPCPGVPNWLFADYICMDPPPPACAVPNCATCLAGYSNICTVCKPSYVQVYGRCAFSEAKMTIVDEVPNGLVKASIKCDSPLAVIQNIQRATWGRPGTCQTDFTGTIAWICNGRNMCQFNVGNDALGDPCPGQPKMFISEYVCQDDIWNDGSIAGKAINHTVTLEGNPLEVDCMNGKKLQFVRAVYGATDRGFCPNEIVNGGLLTCKNRSKCAMTVGNIELGLQDPCGGVVKALFADFICT